MTMTNEQTNITKQKDFLLRKRERLLKKFSESAQRGHKRRLTESSAKIEQVNDFLSVINQLECEAQAASTVPRFSVSSLFLHESFKKLTADQDEQFFFITGSEVDGTFVLDQWAEFAHQKRSVVGVTADTKSTHNLLIKLERFGHRLLAHFHSHPGDGADSTRPSGTDEDYQRRLETAGHVAVMAIFSRDGFIRFKRLDDSFDLQIFGEGVERHEGNVFRLTEIDKG